MSSEILNLSAWEIVHDFIRDYSGGNISDGNSINWRQTLYKFNVARSRAIIDYYNQGRWKELDEGLFQQTLVNLSPRNKSVDCKAYVSSSPVGKVVFIGKNSGTRVSDRYMQVFYDQIQSPMQAAQLTKNRELSPGTFNPAYTISGNKVIIYGAKGLKECLLHAIYVHPVDVKVYDPDKDRNVPFDIKKDPFPVTWSMLPRIREILDREFQLLLNIPQDETVDGKQNINTQTQANTTE